MELRGATEVRLDRRPVLLGGDVLATSGDGPLTVRAGDAAAAVDGVGRITRTLAVSVTSQTPFASATVCVTSIGMVWPPAARLAL